MTLRSFFLLLLFSICFTRQSSAVHMVPEISRIPIDRVTTNLETKLRSPAIDLLSRSRILHQLARLHAMAHVLILNEVPYEMYGARDESLDRVSFDELVKIFSTTHKNWGRRELPSIPSLPNDATKNHLESALKYYRELLAVNPGHKLGQLGLGWCLILNQDYESAKKVLRDWFAPAQPKRRPNQRRSFLYHLNYLIELLAEPKFLVEFATAKVIHGAASLVGVSYAPKNFLISNAIGKVLSAEAYSYLVPLLDPEKDRDEIAALRSRVWMDAIDAEASAIQASGVQTPVALSLRGSSDWKESLDPKARVAFDLNATGQLQHWTWIRPSAGWLIYLSNRHQKLVTGSDLFGGTTFRLFWHDGFEALCSLDDDQNGSIEGEELQNIHIWNDKNVDGKLDRMELLDLRALNIQSIRCNGAIEFEHGYMIQDGVTLTNGQSVPLFDFLLRNTNDAPVSDELNTQATPSEFPAN